MKSPEANLKKAETYYSKHQGEADAPLTDLEFECPRTAIVKARFSLRAGAGLFFAPAIGEVL